MTYNHEEAAIITLVTELALEEPSKWSLASKPCSYSHKFWLFQFKKQVHVAYPAYLQGDGGACWPQGTLLRLTTPSVCYELPVREPHLLRSSLVCSLSVNHVYCGPPSCAASAPRSASCSPQCRNSGVRKLEPTHFQRYCILCQRVASIRPI